jgi:2-dehydropantoate 2-reductase
MNSLTGAKIAVVGAGAVGAYYGGMLAHAGYEVTLLLRSDFDAVRARGLIIHSRGQTLQFPVKTAATPCEIGPVDLVLIGIKATANQALEQLLPPLIGQHTVLLTLQNGLGNDDFLAERWGAERIMGALCFVCLNRIGPGEIRHLDHGSITVGEFLKSDCPRTLAVVDAFVAAGIAASGVENLQAERWRKLVWNVPFNGLSIAAGGVTVADILNDPLLQSEARALMYEVTQAADSMGYFIEPDYVTYQINRSWSMGPYRPSSLIDWQLGFPVEVEAIWGEPLKRAAAVGVNTPRLQLLYSLLSRLTSVRQC